MSILGLKQFVITNFWGNMHLFYLEELVFHRLIVLVLTSFLFVGLFLCLAELDFSFNVVQRDKVWLCPENVFCGRLCSASEMTDF